ncbi:hypothetical protein HanIR_Chr07g0304611 [Helianthus annuus]|nr:hypothetical protein HanIR_Chr07g0304611 [Helianthus annuus]
MENNKNKKCNTDFFFAAVREYYASICAKYGIIFGYILRISLSPLAACVNYSWMFYSFIPVYSNSFSVHVLHLILDRILIKAYCNYLYQTKCNSRVRSVQI